MPFKIYISKKSNFFLSSFIIILGFSLLLCTNYKSFFSLPVESSASSDCITVPIIMYHSILKNRKSLGKFVISPDEFEEDLKYLKENQYNTIFIEDLINFIYNNEPLPEKPIMLTFDDGYYNNYLYVFPLLKKYESKIVLSPIGIETDKYSEINDTNPNYAHCSWENLKEMCDSGYVEIQNHSYNMHKMSKKRSGTKKNKNESISCYKKTFSEDALLMQQKVEENLKIAPTTFTFPFGAISNCSIDILKELGFKAALSCESKINVISKDPNSLFGLKRYLRPSGIQSKTFFENKVKLSKT